MGAQYPQAQDVGGLLVQMNQGFNHILGRLDQMNLRLGDVTLHLDEVNLRLDRQMAYATNTRIISFNRFMVVDESDIRPLVKEASVPKIFNARPALIQLPAGSWFGHKSRS